MMIMKLGHRKSVYKIYAIPSFETWLSKYLLVFHHGGKLASDVFMSYHGHGEG